MYSRDWRMFEDAVLGLGVCTRPEGECFEVRVRTARGQEHLAIPMADLRAFLVEAEAHLAAVEAVTARTVALRAKFGTPNLAATTHGVVDMPPRKSRKGKR